MRSFVVSRVNRQAYCLYLLPRNILHRKYASFKLEIHLYKICIISNMWKCGNIRLIYFWLDFFLPEMGERRAKFFFSWSKCFIVQNQWLMTLPTIKSEFSLRFFPFWTMESIKLIYSMILSFKKRYLKCHKGLNSTNDGRGHD